MLSQLACNCKRVLLASRPVTHGAVLTAGFVSSGEFAGLDWFAHFECSDTKAGKTDLDSPRQLQQRCLQ